MRFCTVLLVLLFSNLHSNAQLDRYIVTFTDKGHNDHSLQAPQQFLSQRALNRRARYNIPIDSFDLPVTQRYIDSVRLAGTVSILNTSKWLNQVAIRTTDANALTKILSLPFVNTVTAIASRTAPSNNFTDKWERLSQLNQTILPRSNNSISDSLSYGYANGQVKMHNTDFLHRLGFSGDGMQMAVLDAGFFRYDELGIFDSMLLRNNILGTWDFVEMDDQVAEDHLHGTQCLSVIAANQPGTFVGMAPHTGFYLYRTEDVASEYPIEEHFLAAGFEKADSAGADITSTSLGYSKFTHSQFNYTYTMMDGNTTMGARAADIGASRGMLMVVSAGNEGSTLWRYITTPADADSVIAVAAVDTAGNVGFFSSYGPAADGDVKPTLAAAGWNAIVVNPFSGDAMYNSGTSFAAPNLAGVATCLWQAFPELSNMEIYQVLIRSAHQYNNPDDRTGYGIPDVKKAFTQLVQDSANANMIGGDCTAQLKLRVKQGADMDVFLERKPAGADTFQLLHTFSGNGAFDYRELNFEDHLNNLQPGDFVYRWGMRIGGDTTFLLDSVSYTHPQHCVEQSPGNTVAVLYPNPSRGAVKLDVESVYAAPLVITIHNALGQQITRQHLQQPAQRVTHTLPAALAPGYYIVTVTLDGKRILREPLLIQSRW